MTNGHSALTSFWHPVALLEDVIHESAATELFGRPVLARRAGAEFEVLLDGQVLKSGTSAQGAVVRRYGLLWVCHGVPIVPLPMIEALPQDFSSNAFGRKDEWRASASQIMDNFVDVAHFAYVHRESFARDEKVEMVFLEELPSGFRARFRGRGRRVLGKQVSSTRSVERILDYEYAAPFSLMIKIQYGATPVSDAIFLALQPKNDQETVVYKLVQRSERLLSEPDASAELRMQRQINEEDKRIVECLPNRGISLSEDLLLDFDAPGAALRSALSRTLHKSEIRDAL